MGADFREDLDDGGIFEIQLDLRQSDDLVHETNRSVSRRFKPRSRRPMGNETRGP